MLRVPSGRGQDAESPTDNNIWRRLEEILGRPVLVKSDPALHHEKFDLA